MKRVLFRLFLALLAAVSCRKEKEAIPEVSVYIYVSTTDPQFSSLNAVGGWVYFAGGSRGIVAYRLSQEEFRAYDRHCPYKPSDSCGKVEVESSGVTVQDPCCGSVFLLTEGSVVKGPASRPLKKYNTSFDGNVLVISN